MGDQNGKPTADELELQRLDEKQKALNAKAANYGTQRTQLEAELAQAQQQMNNESRGLLNGHAIEAERNIERLEAAMRKLQHKLNGLQQLQAELDAEREKLSAAVQEVSVRVGEQKQAELERQLEDALASAKLHTARCELALVNAQREQGTAWEALQQFRLAKAAVEARNPKVKRLPGPPGRDVVRAGFGR